MANTEKSELDEFGKWAEARGYHTVAQMIENFRNFKIRMKELEHIAQLRQAGQAHVENN